MNDGGHNSEDDICVDMEASCGRDRSTYRCVLVATMIWSSDTIAP